MALTTTMRPQHELIKLKLKYFRVMMLVWARVLERKCPCCVRNQHITRVSLKLMLEIVLSLNLLLKLISLSLFYMNKDVN